MSIPGVNIIGDGSTNFLYGTNGDDSFAGANIAETITPGLGNDVVFAGGGQDTVYADFGNDWLHGGSATDWLYFDYINAVTGITSEPNYYSVVFDLAKTVNKMGLLGTKTTYSFENLRGGWGNDKLYGSGEGNHIQGDQGADLLAGRGGGDVLEGGYGKDTINGGAGQDVLSGYASGTYNDVARDTFVYGAISESTVAAPDHIWGFFSPAYPGSLDKIDLHLIDANGSAKGNGTFAFIGGNSFHANSTGEIRVTTTSDPNAFLIQIDTDTDRQAEMSIVVHTAAQLTKEAFIL